MARTHMTRAILAAMVPVFALTAGPASAAILDPVIDFFTDILADITTLISIVGAVAVIVGLIMMMFGRGNAWQVMIIGVVIVLAANAQDIVAALTA